MRKLLCCLVPLVASGQEPAHLALKPAIATLAEEFTLISSVRELSDGRVLVADNAGDARLLVADLRTGRVERIGRPGPGPREYVSPPRRLLPLADDSSLLVSGSRPPRWSIMRDSSILETFPTGSRVFLQANDAVGADTFGNVLARRPSASRYRRTRDGGINSYDLLLANRRSGAIDTIAALAGETYSVRGSSFFQQVFSVPEAAMLFRDGWVAVVRLNPYRVEWRSPSGRWIRGQPLPAKPVKVDQREISAYLARTGSSKISWAVAEFIPPLGTQIPIPMPDGSLAIRRMPWSKAPGTDYDVVNRGGKLVATIHMAPAERIVGFGAAAVFIATRDDDGLEHLRKHPWQ